MNGREQHFVGMRSDMLLLSANDLTNSTVGTRLVMGTQRHGVSGRHFYINFDNYRRIVLRDNSSAGTIVSYDGQCARMQITREAIKPTIFPRHAPPKVVRSCQNSNEAKVHRDITPFLVPPILALDTSSDPYFEHLSDEVNADWNAHTPCMGLRSAQTLRLAFPGHSSRT